MKYKKKKEVKKQASTCCGYEVRYNGFVGLTCYGYACNKCARKCEIQEVTKIEWSY